MEINKTTLIENNKKILDKITGLIETNDLDKLIKKNDTICILSNGYLNKLVYLTNYLSYHYFWYKKKFYFNKNGIWYEYLTDNVKLIKKDGENNKFLINIDFGIVISKTKMYQIFKRNLKKRIKNKIISLVGIEKPKNTDEYFNQIKSCYEDYQKIVNSNENSYFYQILLILCEYVFTYNKEEIYCETYKDNEYNEDDNDYIHEIILP